MLSQLSPTLSQSGPTLSWFCPRWSQFSPVLSQFYTVSQSCPTSSQSSPNAAPPPPALPAPWRLRPLLRCVTPAQLWVRPPRGVSPRSAVRGWSRLRGQSGLGRSRLVRWLRGLWDSLRFELALR